MEFLKHLETYLTKQEIKMLDKSLSKEAKHAVLLNLDKMSKEKFLSLFPNVEPHPFVKNAFIYDKEKYPLSKTIYYELGCFYLQEPSAMMVAHLLDPKHNDLILDLCAAPGGKTIQTSLLMQQTGLIIANDLSYSRASIIKENIEKMGLKNVLITSNDFSSLINQFDDYFDKIILDAPCSGSGMFRKDNKMVEDWSYNKVLKCAELQKQLILYSYKMLKAGGTLIYSTCSFSLEEDEDVIHHLLNNTDAEIVPIESNPLLYSSKEQLGIHLFPHIFPGEGHYICIIKKPGILKSESVNHKININFNNEKLILDYENYLKHQDSILLVNRSVNTNHLNILRYGVKLGTSIKNIDKFDFHFARSLKNFSREIELSHNETLKYLNGESIMKTLDKGYHLLKYEGIPIDLSKCDGKSLKNYYPKAYRKLFK